MAHTLRSFNPRLDGSCLQTVIKLSMGGREQPVRQSSSPHGRGLVKRLEGAEDKVIILGHTLSDWLHSGSPTPPKASKEIKRLHVSL